MKFFHLADLHLGKHLHRYNLREDQIHILKEVVEYARIQKPDAILISGDIYDKSVPSAEAVSLFDGFLTALAERTPKISVMIISGNHDSGERLEYAGQILNRNSIYLAGKPPMGPEDHLLKIVLQDAYGPVNFYLMPFLKPSYVKGVFQDDPSGAGMGNQAGYTENIERLIRREEIDETQRNVILSHQFYTGKGCQVETCDSELINVGGLDNVDSSVLAPFDYAALGHIHGRQKVGREEVRYCGTLLKYSVSEANHIKGLSMITLNGKDDPVKVEVLPLHPLHDVMKKTGHLEDILEEGRQGDSKHYVSVTLTDEVENYKPREQLELVYPLLLEVRVDNARTKRRLELNEEAIQIRNPLEMFGDFYREVHGSALDAEGVEALEQILEDMEGA